MSLAFLALFSVQRHSSDLLEVEQRAGVAQAVAAAAGEPAALVMALHYVRGGELQQAELEVLVRRYQELRTELGSPALAAVALEQSEVARRLLAEAGGVAAAEAALWRAPEGVIAGRIESVTALLQARGW